MPRRIGRTGLALAAIDVLSAIIVVSYREPPKPASAIRTQGEYAVVLTWPKKCDADLDLYVRQPNGEIVYFNHMNGSVVHLEHDDIPANRLGYQGQQNYERAVLRQLGPGEYTVNVHSYSTYSCEPPVPSVVELWRLRGEDVRVFSQRLSMGQSGDEQTAFRFSIRRNGESFGLNRLSRSLVGLGSR